jgi:hypothetical protein
MTPRLRIALAAVALTVCAAAHAEDAHAQDMGIGIFVGEPLGLTLKVGLEPRSALDIVLGYTTYDDARDAYAHLTYQVAPFVGRGRSVVVPVYLGLGAAVFDGPGDFGDELNLAVRAPLGLALQFRRAPIELYGEVALKIVLLDNGRDDDNVNADGGIGFRLRF